ncbi:RNA polymerase factor sigma-54 [Vagococcus sp. PNs007]|uniref:RNA polymerase factor sigma-54 n=1 Tax=Vagococcus proximus TaxID=2991417 RepID=A0ABT5X2V3_9ENTE|nr:RNA polymerase factor sigma-54 [Vagococcus proximus]MDF0480322.1 RNA polymerase factor sigma-54 [Vagococcus proximus]
MKLFQGMTQKQSQTQKMAMTQQMQQSIQMLQYNSDELQHFLENKALENPLMDVVVEGEFYEQPVKTSSKASAQTEETNYLNQIPDNRLSLFESLLEQIHLNYRDTPIRQTMIYLAEFIDINGYLSIDLNDVASATGVSYIQVVDALTLLQQLDPPGIAARDLQECLLLQIERDNGAPNLAYLVIEEEFENFANRKWQAIAKKYEISLGAIQKIYDFVQLLSPNPGAAYGETIQQYIRPDLIVKKTEEGLEVSSTRTSFPTVNFQQQYFDRMKQTGDQEVDTYLKEKKAEFEWIKKSVTQRGDTILKVGMEIVNRQRDFFLEEGRRLKPLMLKEIAEELSVHESTISRSVNGKYLETSFGIFELRSFFTTGLSDQNSEEDVSASDAKSLIDQLIKNENKGKPLSDQKLVALLQVEGIELSRRTVAKYRDALGIPSSSKRKRFDD